VLKHLPNSGTRIIRRAGTLRLLCNIHSSIHHEGIVELKEGLLRNRRFESPRSVVIRVRQIECPEKPRQVLTINSRVNRPAQAVGISRNICRLAADGAVHLS
jgi:hypothetical protein